MASYSRRAKGRILAVCNSWRNAEDGGIDKQDLYFNLCKVPNTTVLKYLARSGLRLTMHERDLFSHQDANLAKKNLCGLGVLSERHFPRSHAPAWECISRLKMIHAKADASPLQPHKLPP